MTNEKRTSPKPATPVTGKAISRLGLETREDRQNLNRAEIRQRQRSMMNAMLCYMI